MVTLSDSIEDYIKKLLSLSSRLYVDIRRRELAQKFSCAPSQINYVLERRFSAERGYLIESRRGGRGYIRIYRINPLQKQAWKAVIDYLAGGDFEPDKALQFIKRCREENIITRREGRILQALLKDELYTALVSPEIKVRSLQKRIFKAAIEEILKGSY